MISINELIKKYNRPGPRYTSYPPVPFWNKTPRESEWISHIKSNYQEAIGIDLYVHIPFCESLCFYCGCNRTITKNHSVEDPYMKAVLREWEIYCDKLGFTPRVNSLHFGGGTPTFLSPEKFEILLSVLLRSKSPSFIGSVEVDPRTCSDEHLEVLSRFDIKRISLGIQDFDPLVQKAINRDQSPKMVEALLEKLKKNKFNSINFDLIYGLPKQSLQSIETTINIVAGLNPDLIAFYSYAHLPDRIKNQRLIQESDLPTPDLKKDFYELGKKLLIENGYVDIGMDHFARPTSFLYQAMVEKRLHRNFMGYVDKKSSILIGLGPSSISDSSMSFVQNVKNVKSYEEKIEAGHLAFEIGHTQSKEDLAIQKIILEMMCQDEFKIGNKMDLPFWEEINKDLSVFQEDGLLKIDNDLIKITKTGRGFVRNIAMSFDHYLREKTSKAKFSQTI